MPIPAALPIDPQLPGDLSEWPSLSVIGGDGVFWDLTDARGHVQIQPGWTGFDLPPASSFVDATPNLAGGAYQGSHDDPRTLFMPVYTTGRNREETVDYRRRFLKSIHHSRGPATIVVAETDGTHRSIQAVYQSGAEGSEGEDQAGLHWGIYGLNFLAADDPYWTGTQRSAGPWRISNPVQFYPLAPMLFRLSGSQVLGDTKIDNKGDVDAYPVWTLKGPATSMTLTLGDRSFVITPNLLTGETLTINADPAHQTIVDGTGANRWSDVDDDAYDLWELPPGLSVATVLVTAGDTTTELSMTYTPKYLVK